MLAAARALPPNPNLTGNHSYETVAAAFRSFRDPKIQALMWLQAESSRMGVAYGMAQMVRRLWRALRVQRLLAVARVCSVYPRPLLPGGSLSYKSALPPPLDHCDH